MAPRRFEGGEWQVRRRWVAPGWRLPRWRTARSLGVDHWELLGSGPLPDDFSASVVVAIALLVIVLIGIPLLLFGFELIVAGVVVAAGVLGRVLLFRPWMIEATNTDTGAVYRREVSGWRASSRAVAEFAESLRSGESPSSVSGPDN